MDEVEIEDEVELKDEPLRAEVLDIVEGPLRDKDVVLPAEEFPLSGPDPEVVVEVLGVVDLPAPTLIPIDRSVPEVEKEEIVLLVEEVPLMDPVVEVIVVVPRIIVVELPSPALTPTDRSVPEADDKDRVVELPTPALTPIESRVPDGRILFTPTWDS